MLTVLNMCRGILYMYEDINLYDALSSSKQALV